MDEPEVIEASEPASEVELLREEVAELRDQLEAAENENRRLWQGYHGAGGLTALIVLGPSLVRSARAWFGKVGTKTEPIPRRESADLFAAVIRRFIAVGALGLLMAGATPVLMWQQNQYFREQNAQFREQLDSHATDTRIVRRAQLLNTIYELADCDEAELDERERACPPKASARLRREAVLAIAALDRNKVDLRGANLKGVDLGGVDLSGSNLGNADLSWANLGFANLTNADLSYASLAQANLAYANLQGASIHNANLSGAKLREVSMGGADLHRARLYGAEIFPREPLDMRQVRAACGDSETGLPAMALHWSDDLFDPPHFLRHPFNSETDPPGAGCP